ncbi:MAG: S-layer homology domain-containing protein [Peptococcaceae bacterium]|nr:S-layer homology domain-containing protein [Peptococcaceae bacterium]
MNRQKHKLSRRILAVLLMAAMLITMLPSAIFAAPRDHRPGGGDSTQPENAVSINKTAERVGPDTWNVTMTVKASKEIQSEPLELVLLLDRSGSMAWCTHSGHQFGHGNWGGGQWCDYPGEESWKDSRQAIAGNAAKGLIDDLVEKGISASVSVVGFADQYTGYGSNTEVRQSRISLTKTSAEQIKGKIPTTGASGGTYMNYGLELADQQFSNGATNKVIILLADGEHNGTDPNDKEGYVSTLKEKGVKVYTIGFTTSNNTLETIAKTTGGKYDTADNAEDLADVFTQIAGDLTAMVEDDMGDDVEIVVGSEKADNGTVSVSRDGKLSWNPKDGKLGAGQSAEITYTVKLTDEKKATLQVGNNTVNLNGDAVLTYKLNGQGKTYTMDFPRPTDNVEYAKLSVYNNVDGTSTEDTSKAQYALVYDNQFLQEGSDGSYTAQPFTWVTPENNIGEASYSNSTLTVPGAKAVDVKESDFSQKLTPVTGGEYKLVHKYNSVREDSLTVQIYVDGNPVGVNNYDDLKKYIQDLTNAGETNSVELAYNDGKVTVSYDYEKYNSADLNFKVTDGLVLQAVNGEFIVGQSYWKGVVSEDDGTMTVDNVKGGSTLEIYLNKVYTVTYSPNDIVDEDNTIYIVKAKDVEAPKGIATSEDAAKDLTDEERSAGHKGGWVQTGLSTTVDLKDIAPEKNYIGWYTTDTYEAEHEQSYFEADIATIAAATGAANVIECYAKQKAPGLTVEKSISKVAKADGTEISGSEVENVAAGDTIYYTVTVENSGNVALDNIQVTDTLKIGDKSQPLDLYMDNEFKNKLPETVSLEAGASETYYAKYTVDENDLGKKLSNTATATDGTTEGEDSTDPITVDNPKLTVEKSIVSIAGQTEIDAENPTAKVDDTIVYKIVVKNEGNVTLSDIDVTDTLTTGEDKSVPLTLYTDDKFQTELTGKFTLEAGVTEELYASYTVKDGDTKLLNSATATSDDETTGTDDTPEITVETPGLEVTKTIKSINGEAPGEKPTAGVGDVIIYEITVENTGNVALSNVTVTDKLNETTEVTLYSDSDCQTEWTGTFNLEPEAQKVLYAKYPVQENDKTLINAATATSGDGTTDKDTTEPITVEHPELSVIKTIETIGDTVVEDQENPPAAQVGDTIKYKIVVTNNGNVDLNGINVTDELTISDEDEAKILVLVDENGTELEGTINLEADKSVTYYATYEVTTDDANKTLTNAVTAKSEDGTEGGDETPGIETSSLYTLIYDANGGTIGEDVVAEATNQKPGNVKLWQWTEENGTFTSTGTLPDGFNADTQNVPKHADAPAPADTIISDAGESVPVVFIGWTEEPATDDAGKVDQSKIFAAGEELPATKNEVTIDAKTDMNGKAVYAVWGYDENGDGIADAEQVIVTPADIKIYTGGNGYSSVVNDVNAAVDNSTTSDGLPTPGYYIILPNDVNEKVLAKAEQDGATVTNGAGQKVADLSKYLTFDYSNGNETRHWTLERYDGTSGNTSMAYDKFIYRINPATTSVEGESVPIRLLFTDANGNEKISDDFTVSDDVLYQTFDMTIYAGDLDRGLIEATFTSNTGVSAQDIGVGSGTLTVRGVVTDENTTVNTTPILEAGADVDSATNVSVQLQNANTNFYINESQLEVADPDSVKLLVDDTVSEESDATMQNLAVETFSDTITEDHSVDMKYLDLVDTSNGNTWVTTDQEVTVFWPYPDDADRSGEFHVVHYTGLDRDEGGALDNNYSTDNMELYSTTESGESGITKTDNGILFTVDSFSPFAVYYTAADDEGDDNPPYYPWQPDGDDDGPSGLNTEDHFSYVVGYAEDYRTGEATDNEDLWPVKPNNQITRAEVATIFYRLLEDEVRDEYDTTTNDFSDVTADSWYNQTVSTLARMGIVKGYEDGSFRPNAPITRAEFGAIATRFFAETGATYVPGTFTDVTGDEWYANAIQDAVNLGLIGGYPDGTVRPNNNITRAEACAIVNRTLGRVPDADHLLPEDVMKVWPDNNPTDWFYADMQEATNGHEYAWIEEDGHEIEEWTNLLDKDWTDR